MLEEYGQPTRYSKKTGISTPEASTELLDLNLMNGNIVRQDLEQIIILVIKNIINWSKNGKDMIRPRLDSVVLNQEGLICQTGEIRVSLFKGFR
jgi:hypothetical protein